MSKKDMTGLKNFLVEECINNGNMRSAVMASEIDLQTFMCSFEDGEWANITADKFQDLMRWKESLGWELNMQIQCSLGDGETQNITVHDVQNLGFKDGDFIVIGRDAIVTNIDFAQELQAALNLEQEEILERA